MDMGNKLMIGGIAVLVIMAVILGYLIYQETLGPKPQSVSQQTQTPTIPQTVGDQQTRQSASATDNAIIAADRKKISEYPGPGAPEAQGKEFQEIIDRNAQSSETLDITKCETNPMVLKVKRGPSIKIVNNDSESNTILFGPDNQYEVPPRDSANMVVDLDPGIHRYRCTSISGSPIVGAFVVTE